MPPPSSIVTSPIGVEKRGTVFESTSVEIVLGKVAVPLELKPIDVLLSSVTFGVSDRAKSIV